MRVSADRAVHSCNSAYIHTSRRIVFSLQESYNLRHMVREGVERSDVTAFSGRVQSCSPLATIVRAVCDQSKRGAGLEAARRRAIHQDRETACGAARSALP